LFRNKWKNCYFDTWKNETNIEVKIHNNGKIIKEEDAEAIFDKFYQSRNQNIKKPVGSGLGLAICKKL
jgi:signal transduction histidine kinase